MITLLGLNGGSVSLLAKDATAFDFYRGPHTWLTTVSEYRGDDGKIRTGFSFTGLIESPMVWGALGAAAAVGGIAGFLLGKRKRA